MVMILFHVGEERYACDCDYIVEIVPKVPLKQVSHAPPYLAGLIRYNALLVPVLEFAQLCDNRPCQNMLSTRIIMLRQKSEEKTPQMMGLMAERVTEIIPQNTSDFSKHTVSFQNAAFLTGVLADDGGVIQQVDINQLFGLVSSMRSTK